MHLIEGLTNGDAAPFQFHLHQRQTVHQNRHVVAVGMRASLLKLLDDLQLVAGDVLFVQQVDILDMPVVEDKVVNIVVVNLAGFLDDALDVLDEATLRVSGDAARLRFEDPAQSWLLRARILMLKNDLDGAREAYAGAVATSPLSYEAWYAYSNFNQNQGRYREATRGFARALKLARRAESPPQIASALNNLGILYGAENRKVDARRAHEAALRIRRELARAEPGRYLRAVATTLTDLGVLNRAENRPVDALAVYEEALSIRRRLQQDSPGEFLSGIATTLNNLGNLHRQESRPAQALNAFEEALAIQRELAERNPSQFLHDVGATLNNIGTVHRDEERLTESRTAYDEALRIYRKLEYEIPGLYRSYVAITLNNIGVLHKESRRLPDRKSTRLNSSHG